MRKFSVLCFVSKSLPLSLSVARSGLALGTSSNFHLFPPVTQNAAEQIQSSASALGVPLSRCEGLWQYFNGAALDFTRSPYS